jgi:hypothetical protein
LPAPFTLRNIYRGTITEYTDRDLVTVPIRASLPAVGTELRAFWLGKLGLTESEVGSSVLSAPSGPAGEGMTQLTGPGDIAPVSVASYLAQGNHNSLPTSVVERRGITQLGYIDTVKPYVTTASGVTANPAFPLSRLVYSVIATARLSGTSFQDQALASAFAGPTSQLCSASAMIAAYGYATIGSLCGNTTLYQQALRLS